MGTSQTSLKTSQRGGGGVATASTLPLDPPLKPSTLLVSTTITIILLEISISTPWKLQPIVWKNILHIIICSRFCKIWSVKRLGCPTIKCSCQPPPWPLQQSSWSQRLPSLEFFLFFSSISSSCFLNSNLASCLHHKHCPHDFIFFLRGYKLEMWTTQGANNNSLVTLIIYTT